MLLVVAALLVLPVVSEGLELHLYPDPPGAFLCGRLVDGADAGGFDFIALLRLDLIPTANGALLSGLSIGCQGVDHPASGHLTRDSAGRYVGVIRLEYATWSLTPWGWPVPVIPPTTLRLVIDAGTGQWTSEAGRTGSLLVYP
jgi:hypothetical protein